MAEDDLMNEDLYAIVGIDGNLSSSSTPKEIKKAFKIKSLKLHPDHNKATDASAQFDKFKKAVEFLLDEKKRQAYDAKLRARQERKRRIAEDDDLTRKMKERLAAREAAVSEQRSFKKQKTEEQRTKQESMDFIEDMKKAGLLGKRRTVAGATPSKSAAEGSGSGSGEPTPTTVVVKWPASAEAPTREALLAAFGVYGKVLSVIIKAKKSRALLVFEDRFSASEAVKHEAAYRVSLKDKDTEEAQADDAGSERKHEHKRAQAEPELKIPSFSAEVAGGDPIFAPRKEAPTATVAGTSTQTFEDKEGDVLKKLAAAAKRRKEQAQQQAKAQAEPKTG